MSVECVKICKIDYVYVSTNPLNHRSVVNPIIVDYHSKTISESIDILSKKWLKKEQITEKKEFDSAHHVIIKAFENYSVNGRKKQVELWKFKTVLEEKCPNIFISEERTLANLLQPLLPPPHIILFNRELPVLPPIKITVPSSTTVKEKEIDEETFVIVTTNTGQESINQKKIKKFDMLLKKFTNTLVKENAIEFELMETPAEKSDLESQQIYAAQELYMRRIMTLFLQDYIFPQGQPGDEFNLLLHRHLTDKFQPFLKYVVENHCFNTASDTKTIGVNENVKWLLNSVLKSAGLFLNHLSSVYVDWRKKNINLIHVPLQTEGELLLKGLDERRKEAKMSSLLLPQLQPIENKAILIEVLKKHIDLLLQSHEEKIGKQNLEFICNWTYIFANRTAAHAFQALSSETIASFIRRLIRNEFVLAKIDKSPPLDAYSAPDEKFSQAVGQLIGQLAKDVLGLIDSGTVMQFGLNTFTEYVNANPKSIGDLIQKAMNRIGNSPSRLKLFQVLSHILWRQNEEDWEPILSSTKESLDANAENLEDKLSDYIYKQVLAAIGPDENSSFIGKIAKKATAKVVDIQGSFEVYIKQTTRTIFRLLQHREVLLMGLIYVMEGFQEKTK